MYCFICGSNTNFIRMGIHMLVCESCLQPEGSFFFRTSSELMEVYGKDYRRVYSERCGKDMRDLWGDTGDEGIQE